MKEIPVGTEVALIHRNNVSPMTTHIGIVKQCIQMDSLHWAVTIETAFNSIITVSSKNYEIQEF